MTYHLSLFVCVHIFAVKYKTTLQCLDLMLLDSIYEKYKKKSVLCIAQSLHRNKCTVLINRHTLFYFIHSALMDKIE